MEVKVEFGKDSYAVVRIEPQESREPSWQVSAMVYEGRWYIWKEHGEYGAWGLGSPHRFSKAEAVKHARWAFGEVPWIYGVKVEEIKDEPT